jgi:hypothetical protein
MGGGECMDDEGWGGVTMKHEKDSHNNIHIHRHKHRHRHSHKHRDTNRDMNGGRTPQ